MDRFEIHTQVNDENDLYNAFDASRQTLNGNVINYIAECYSGKHFRKKPALVFSGVPIDAGQLSAALQRTIQRELEWTTKEKNRNTVKMLRMGLIGLAFIAVDIYLGASLSAIRLELFSIIGSFALWEAAKIRLVSNPENRLHAWLLNRLKETEIIVNDEVATSKIL